MLDQHKCSRDCCCMQLNQIGPFFNDSLVCLFLDWSFGSFCTGLCGIENYVTGILIFCMWVV